jgi:hypothetical protein
MFANSKQISLRINSEIMPELRYAIGATLIMAFAMAFGGQLAFVIPYLALNFLAPGTKIPKIKQAVIFILIVAVSSISALIFTSFFFPYPLVYIPLLALILFWIFYTDKISFIAKIFLIMSFLAIPVPNPLMNVTEWGAAIAITLITGSASSIFMVWIVYSLFPDKKTDKETGNKTAKAASKLSQRERINNALAILFVTFPVIIVFIFFQLSDYLLILVYIVLFTMMSDVGKIQSKIKIYGNIIGGIATIIFYEMIIIVPEFFFFVLLFFGTALFFSKKIFSGKTNAVYYKTAFSTLTLIIGDISMGSENASNEIYLRIIQIFIAVIYIIIGLELINHIKKKRT